MTDIENAIARASKLTDDAKKLADTFGALLPNLKDPTAHATAHRCAVLLGDLWRGLQHTTDEWKRRAA